MRNNGLFSTLFIDKICSEVELDDAGQGRMAALRHARQNSDLTSLDSLWNTYIKQALSYLSFVPPSQPEIPGVCALYEDYSFSNTVTVLYLIHPGEDLDDMSIGCFWPGKLIAQLKDRKLNWSILTDGDRWRLYTTHTGKPFEEYVELNLAEALAQNDEKEYALFERFFHVDSFTPELAGEEGDDCKKDALAHGVYTCRLDRDVKDSEKTLEEKVKSPLLEQIDEVLQYLCNGFIVETRRQAHEYTEDERREIFESAVKLLYRCLFLFYAEARSLLPSQIEKQEIYAKHSIGALCREAHRFRWGKRTDHDGYDLWKHLKGLIGAVNDGDPEYGIMGYNGGLFDDEEEKFLGKEQLRNDFLARALYLMAWVEPHDSDEDKEYPIPYRDLEVRHLGEMYENILEFTVKLADADLIRRRTKKGVEILLASETAQRKGDGLIRKGEVWFGESALERKQTGSYYTPESLVHFLNVKAVIGTLRKRFEEGNRERFDLFIREAKTGHDLMIRRGAAQSAVALVERFVREVVLRFKLCDPAMGSGHFLVNASNQITDFIVGLLAEIPAVEGMVSQATCEPNTWRRLVTRHCLYGVDLNPLAVHLAKLSLWLNSFARNHKLTFLDHHLRCGNSLIGIRSLYQLAQIPERTKDAKRKNKADRQVALPLPETLTEAFQRAARDLAAITDIAEDNTDRQKELHEEARTERISPLLPLADLYTAYLMDGNVQPNDYQTLFLRLSRGESPASVAELELNARVKALAAGHRFFHWPLEFPDVFTEDEGGFDAVVGNPPWDVLKPNSLEFFSTYDPRYRTYKKQEAAKMADYLMETHPFIRQRWESYCMDFVQQSEYVRQPSAYRALGKGDINTYKLFLERFFALLKTDGRLGIVTPSGLYTDHGCQPLRELFFNESRIICLYGFENRWPTVFTAVDGRFKFILYCTEEGEKTDSFRCAFMEHNPDRLPVIDAGALEMKLEHVRKFSPDTMSVMEFKNQWDIDITSKIYRTWPLLGEVCKGSWNVKFTAEFHMTNDSHLFLTRDNLVKKGAVEIPGQRWVLSNNARYDAGFLRQASYKELKHLAQQSEIELFLPLWEGKMIWHFDSYFEPSHYWVSFTEGTSSLGQSNSLSEKYRACFRDVAAATNERTLISSLIPCSYHGNTIPSLIVFAAETANNIDENQVALWFAAFFSSYCCDFIIRNKITNHMNFFYMNSLPIPRTISDEIISRGARLICTSTDFRNLWADIFRDDWKDIEYWYPDGKASIECYGPRHEQDIRCRLAEEAANLTQEWTPTCGVHERTADRRDTGDRAQLRAEIDAYVAHLYGLSRDDFAYILDTFPVLKRKEEQAFGEFMSKRKCLEEYNRIAAQL